MDHRKTDAQLHFNRLDVERATWDKYINAQVFGKLLVHCRRSVR